ncbi:GNAT family N-acetyltransferase [Microbacterium sp.]|uniref:GNAT family N-acetyltransferase n=1 Tax=Microbacterium sp. TaxID=51671 RepID=UPI0028AD7BE6|nr:GNAT family N-acetyltransferase [Microbacterium sp.]
MSPEISVTSHRDLTRGDLAGLRALFDAEYLSEFGDWDPDQPYGYAPHDVHVIARRGDETVAHVGWARRDIRVDGRAVAIAGVGGVLVADQARGLRLGERLMSAAAASMREAGGVEFGYLGCRESVVPFYRSCGWTRVAAVERSVDRRGRPTVTPAGAPILVFPLDSARQWPEGDIDLRGRAW